MKRINITLAALAVVTATASAQGVSLKSTIVSTNSQPIEGAVITIKGGGSTVTDKMGNFDLKANDKNSSATIHAQGYYDRVLPLSFFEKKQDAKIVLVPVNEKYLNGYVTTPTETKQFVGQNTATTTGLEQKDYSDKLSVGSAIGNNIAGLQNVEKSGMPNEGTYMNLRGYHSVVGDNMPLIVINGVPYFGNQETSSIINGYSRDILAGYSPKDIRSVTVLKGAEAAEWGVLGSNGVIMIETQQANSDNLNTKITFSGQYGMSWAQKNLPMLDAAQYKTYMQGLGLTRYPSFSALTGDYPFLQNGTNYTGSYLFNENNNWIDEISKKGFMTDNQLRIEGGDEIAKYNISFGYTKNDGTMKGTSSDRYHTLISADVLVTRNLDIFADVALSYINSELQNMGTKSAVNAQTSALWNSPMISQWQKQFDSAHPNGAALPLYAKFNEWNTSSNPMFAYDNVSNPMALVTTVEGSDKIYDANATLGLNFKWNDYLTLQGRVGLYYNYTEENMFIPGVSSSAIIPQYFGDGKNYIASGVVRQLTNNYQVNAQYKRTFGGIHDLNVKASARFMTHKLEYDMANGYNTANDFFKTLDKLNNEKNTIGSNYYWNYMGYGLHAKYVWNKIISAKAGLNIDASSASGADATRLGLFPSAGVTFMLANTGILPTGIDRLNVSVEGSMTGNARFSSNYSKNYYETADFLYLGGIARANMPNTKLSWEKTRQLDLGIDFAALKNRLSFGFNYFFSNSYDLLINSKISSVYGSTQYYDNLGEINNHGFEVSLRGNIIRTKDWNLVAGLTVGHYDSKLKSLGGVEKNIVDFNVYGDDAQVAMQVGRNPYEFYGFKTAGVYATTAEAQAANLKNAAGIAYQAGDMIFVDQNGDGIINDADKIAIGCATPDVFGAINLGLSFKQFTLDVNFAYSLGNDAYNYTRRLTESMDKFYNQSTSVLNRWQVEGQKTNIPRAVYGDVIGNSVFSDRWIEDASYLKLRSLKLSYNFGRLFNFINGGNVWVAAENLFTITKYLGADPEFAYSYSDVMRGFDYGKLANPRTVKIGFNLDF